MKRHAPTHTCTWESWGGNGFPSVTRTQLSRSTSHTELGWPAYAEGGGLWGWTRTLEGWALFLFVFGAMFLNGNNQQRILGLVLCGVAFTKCACSPRLAAHLLLPIPPELCCYAAWVLWAGLSGPFVARSLGGFWTDYCVVLQMLGLVAAVYIVLRFRPQALGGALLALVGGGLIQVGAVLSGVGSLAGALASEATSGISANRNGLGFFMVWSILGLLLLLGFAGRLRKWVAVAGLMLLPAFLYVLFISGSRKSFIAVLFLLVSWILCASSLRQGLVGMIRRVLLLLVAMALLSAALPIITEHTNMGARFASLLAKGDTLTDMAETDGRAEMYRVGLDLVVHHPISGVGLNQYSLYYEGGTYSHSDYVEPLAATGFLGFVLYHSFYFCILTRTLWLLRKHQDAMVRYRLKIIVLGTLTIMLIGLGVPHYANGTVFVLLSIFSVYSVAVGHDLDRLRAMAPNTVIRGWGAQWRFRQTAGSRLGVRALSRRR